MIADASTPNTSFSVRKSGQRRHKAYCLILWLSVLMMPIHGARAESARCMAPEGHFGNYQAAKSATSVPDIAFITATGQETTLQAYKGRGIVLNFWATWCAPCVREMPQLDRLSAFVKGNAIDVLTISEDRKALVVAPKFYKTHNLRDLPVLADPKGRLMRAFKAPGLPLTVLISPQGYEIGRVLGPAEWDSQELVGFIRSCLSGKSS